jgi:hypothetical protein
VPPQTPALQTSVCEQATPSLQPVLLALFMTVQPPEPLQTDDAWHWLAVHV